MMRFKFDEQLARLNEELITMGSLCEKAIATSAKALTTGDFALAEDVPDIEAQINQKERDIESLCLKLLLQQQPVARDLRTISSAHISALDDTLNIGDMADAAIKMVTDSIDAFVKKDIAIARSVIEYDDVVDGYFDKIKFMLINLFSQPESDGEYALDLLMITKYFERIGDHAVNIANWVLFSITGNREKEA